jgi:hypothetical protein
MGRFASCFAMLLLATAGIAIAQLSEIQPRFEIPKTAPINNAKGERIGTATMSGNKIYIRNLENKLMGTVVTEADGSKKLYDPSGKVIDEMPMK